MSKLLIIIALVVLGSLALPAKVLAYSSPAFVTIVNPVRGDEFWDLPNQRPVESVAHQLDLLKKYQLPATWLLRFDALNNKDIVETLKQKPANQELGLFLEVTPSLAKAANVSYHQSSSWHQAGSALLTGYSPEERKTIIQTLFEKFKSVFGFYPTSVGAWWIDSISLKYMTDNYHVNGGLIVADQYSTDDYQIWGQYWATPYYPYKTNALIPSRAGMDKIPVVLMQWATRDPVNGYGKAVEESTYSLQPNDYVDYHNLDINYFNKLVDSYLSQPNNQFNQLTIGLENSYSWNKYGPEYERQLASLKPRLPNGLQVTTMSQFANWYSRQFPEISPSQLIVADNPLGGDDRTVWFENPYYRVGIFKSATGLSIKDIRQYRDGDQEVCLNERCDHVYFATLATRVLDLVTFGKQWQLSEGKINDFKVSQLEGNISITYSSQAGQAHRLTLHPRDISFDNDTYTIDAAILKAQSLSSKPQVSSFPSSTHLQMKPLQFLKDILLFLSFLVVLIIIPGSFLMAQIQKPETFLRWVFLSTVYGLVQFTAISYVSGFLNALLLAPACCLLLTTLFIVKKTYQKIPQPVFDRSSAFMGAVVGLGVIFQILPVVMSGTSFNYGIGFWGPNAHDGIWHLSLVNSLLTGLPPANSTFAGVSLINYHYLYDLLLATTHRVTGIATADLLFRFYPLIFSLFLGLGTISLIELISPQTSLKNKSWTNILTLWLVYFSGSFGWIVEFIRERHFGGESTFWANQPVSFNLNPPFAISLLVCILFFHLLFSEKRTWKSIGILALVNASLLGLKAYAFLLTSAVLVLYSFWELLRNKKPALLVGLLTSGCLALGLYLPNFRAAGVFLFQPFWLIHGMIDFPDRVGWAKLASARDTYFQTGNWFKYLLTEIISLTIFLVGNLGVRVIGLLILIQRKIYREQKIVILLIFTLVSFVLPLLFVQLGNSWNVIQFFYYGMFVSTILAGLWLGSLAKFKLKFVSLALITVIILIAPINSSVTATSYLVSRPHTYISNQELDGLNFLKTQPAGVVLTVPYSKETKNDFLEPRPIYAYETTAYVSAYSEHTTFLEDEIEQEILGTDFVKRRVQAAEFLRSKGLNGNILKDNSIKYIYLQKHYNYSITESPSIRNIFENGEVIIYQIN